MKVAVVPIILALACVATMLRRFFFFIFAIGTCSVGLAGQATQGNTKYSGPWSVLVRNEKGAEQQYPSVCGPLGDFTANPLRFDYGDDMWHWTPDSLSSRADTTLVGTANGRQIYQIVNTVVPKAGNSDPGGQMQLIVVEHGSGQYCLIFDDEDFFGTLSQMGPAELIMLEGDPVLSKADELNGNGGMSASYAWTFAGGTPFPASLGDVVSAAMPSMEKRVPPDCTDVGPRGHFFAEGDPPHPYMVWLWKKNDVEGRPDCGFVAADFAVKDHRLVLTHERYVPPSKSGQHLVLDPKIGPDQPSRYSAVQDGKDWRNPFLIIDASGAEIRSACLLEENWSVLRNSKMR